MNACRALIQSLRHSHKPRSGSAEVATAVTSGVGGCAQRGGVCFFCGCWLVRLRFATQPLGNSAAVQFPAEHQSPGIVHHHHHTANSRFFSSCTDG